MRLRGGPAGFDGGRGRRGHPLACCGARHEPLTAYAKLWGDQAKAPVDTVWDWWQGDRTWQRIDWDVSLVRGGLYRLIHVGDAWFVEGEYD